MDIKMNNDVPHDQDKTEAAQNRHLAELYKIEKLSEENKIIYLAFLDGLLKSQVEQEQFHDFEG